MLMQSPAYMDALEELCRRSDRWKMLKGKSILIAGATGTVGSALADFLMYLNEKQGAEIDVYAMGRSTEKLEKRFAPHLKSARFHTVVQDVTRPLPAGKRYAYLVHAATDAHPVAFAQKPVDILDTNYLGAKNMLEAARAGRSERMLYVSSGEIYGQSTDAAGFDEDYSGPIDSMNPRSCYPVGKRAAETLCACYLKQYDVQSVVVRLSHIYGPTLQASDTRAIAQFTLNALDGRDIIMKSEGTQVRSYCSVFDCVDGMLCALLEGKPGEAYNITSESSAVSIRQLAGTIASSAGTKVVVELPDDAEKSGYTPVLRGVLNAKKMKALGWEAKISFNEGMRQTMDILRQSGRPG